MPSNEHFVHVVDHVTMQSTLGATIWVGSLVCCSVTCADTAWRDAQMTNADRSILREHVMPSASDVAITVTLEVALSVAAAALVCTNFVSWVRELVVLVPVDDPAVSCCAASSCSGSSCANVELEAVLEEADEEDDVGGAVGVDGLELEVEGRGAGAWAGGECVRSRHVDTVHCCCLPSSHNAGVGEQRDGS